MKTLLTALLVSGALLLGATPSPVSASATHGPRGVVPHLNAKVSAASRLQAQTAACSLSGCTSYESGINQFFADVAHDSGLPSNVYSVDTQYSDTNGAIAYASTFGGAFVDTSPYPTNGCADGSTCVNESQLITEIENDITANGWPTGTTKLYYIFLPTGVNTCVTTGLPSIINNPCNTNAFCAYHDSVGVDPNAVVFAVEPDNEVLAGCDSTSTPNGNGTDATINTVSHEMNEAITDPTSQGWFSADSAAQFPEIGDLCAWTFGSSLGSTTTGTYNQVINGHFYDLQQEYSNAANSGTGGCVQRLDGAATAPGIHDGLGPLVYHLGPVMRTNTVYAIYWVPNGAPGVPVNSVPPLLAGVAAAGKTLSTSSGSWSGLPTSYAFKWQRCASDGTGCADISSATGSTYKLSSYDAGHEVRSEVSATNAGGASGYVPSVATEVVVPLPAPTVAPVVSGVTAVGRSISTTPGTWNTPVAYAYQWLRCASSGGSCSSIAGAKSSTYKLGPADKGHTLEARVSGTNAAGTTAVTSAPTATVTSIPAASRLPHIFGEAKVGNSLSVGSAGWSGSPSSFRYQWLRCTAKGSSCVRISGATKSAYQLRKRDARHRLRVKVTAVNDAGRSSSTSAATRLVKR